MKNEAPNGEQQPQDDVSFSLIVPVILVAIVNGMHSPATLVMQELAPVWYPGLLPVLPELVFYFASLMVSTLTLMFAGVPAAIFERATGAVQSSFASMGIWLVGAAVLTIPALGGVMRAIGAG